MQTFWKIFARIKQAFSYPPAHKADYNGRPTLAQLIIIILAVIAVMRFLFDLQGCAANHSIGAGMGSQVSSGDVWVREHPTYGKVFYRGSFLIHPRDSVHIYWEANHKSHPGRRDRGEENVEAGFEKFFP